jgi:ribose transport system ATP-binding protein
MSNTSASHFSSERGGAPAVAEFPAEPGDVVLSTREVTKHYPGVRALSRVSIDVRRGETLGLVGENGAGKSTLLGVVAGVVQGWDGELFVHGRSLRPRRYADAVRAGVGMVFQTLSLVPNLPVYENFFLGREDEFRRGGLLLRGRMRAAARAALDAADMDIDVDRRIDELELSARQSIEILRAIDIGEKGSGETPIVLFDEPTAGLAHHELELFRQRMVALRGRATMVFVSHRLSEVLELCGRLYVLRDGEVIAERASYSTSETELHALMVGRERDVDYYREEQQLVDLPEHPVFEVEGLGLKGVFHDVSFTVRRGEVLGVAGVLGSGKTALGRCIVGAQKPTSGRVLLDGRPLPPGRIDRFLTAGVTYVPPDRNIEGIIKFLSVEWNMTLPSLLDRLVWGGVFLRRRAAKRVVGDFITRLGIKARPSDLVFGLSGGNQQKVVLAKCLARSPSVLVLDNPTRGIDAGAKEQVYAELRVLAQARLPIVLISDDMLEVIGLSNRILVMRDQHVVSSVPAPADEKPSEHGLVSLMV